MAIVKNKNFKIIFIYILKIIFKIFIVFIFFILLWVISFYAILPLGRVSESINQKNVSKIKLGMSRCEVIDILGAPLKSYRTAIYSRSGEIEPNSIEFHYDYSKSGFLWDVDIYVIFNKNGEVLSFAMEEGDIMFYAMYKDHIGNNAFKDEEVFDRIVPVSAKARI